MLTDREFLLALQKRLRGSTLVLQISPEMSEQEVLNRLGIMAIQTPERRLDKSIIINRLRDSGHNLSSSALDTFIARIKAITDYEIDL